MAGIVTFVIFFGLLMVPQAHAQQTSDVTIIKGAGSGQSCVSAKNCFDPSTLNIAAGTAVEWKNADQVSHTVTSGNPSDNQTGTVFDSGLIAPGKEFTFTFKDAGTYHYFCKLHPWMAGEVVVGTSTSNNASAPEFGQVAPIILAIAIMSTVVFSAKRRLSKLNLPSF